MDTKEAIEFLEYLNITISASKYGEFNDNRKNIISLLQQGEKYRECWEKLKKWNGAEMINYRFGNPEYISTIMDKLEQKYFPPASVKKTITIEVEGDYKNISNFADKLNLLVGQINCGIRTSINFIKEDPDVN